MLFVTWRLQGSLRHKPHCATVAAIDRMLDRASGQPQLLALPEFARIVKRAILSRDGELYSLHAWVVMHTQVHLLIEPKAGISFIARIIMDETEDISRMVFWARESFERSASAAECAEVAHWIESHPVRAGLVARPEEWEWSSAHGEPVSRGIGKTAAA